MATRIQGVGRRCALLATTRLIEAARELACGHGKVYPQRVKSRSPSYKIFS